MSVTQRDWNELEPRVRALVSKHGGRSEKLQRLRNAYAFWQPHPGDPGAFALLVVEVEKLEVAP